MYTRKRLTSLALSVYCKQPQTRYSHGGQGNDAARQARPRVSGGAGGLAPNGVALAQIVLPLVDHNPAPRTYGQTNHKLCKTLWSGDHTGVPSHLLRQVWSQLLQTQQMLMSSGLIGISWHKLAAVSNVNLATRHFGNHSPVQSGSSVNPEAPYQ